MKFFRLFLLCSFLFCLGNAQAENSVDLFFDRLQQPQNGASVHIVQDEQIISKMKNERVPRVVNNAGQSSNTEQSNSYNVEQRTRSVAGYRVQLFSSNAPKTAKSEAFRVETDFKNTVAAVSVYVSFTAPFWKVRAGNCRNYQEAVELMSYLKEQFPARRNSMFIVRDNVKIPM